MPPSRRSPAAAAPSGAQTGATAGLGANVASELNELFFAANANERRLILLNLDMVAAAYRPKPPPSSETPRSPSKLEVAALPARREDFANELAQSLLISRQQARRIAGDELASRSSSRPRRWAFRAICSIAYCFSSIPPSAIRWNACTRWRRSTMRSACRRRRTWLRSGRRSTSAETAQAGTHRPLLAEKTSCVPPPTRRERPDQRKERPSRGVLNARRPINRERCRENSAPRDPRLQRSRYRDRI